jgi:uncharacterized protein (TIGR02466 family)
MLNVGNDIHAMFPTTMLHRKIGDESLNAELVKVQDYLEHNTPNVANRAGDWQGGNSSYGSFQSEHNAFLNFDSDAVRTLKNKIEESIADYLEVEMKSIEGDQQRATNKYHIEISDVKYEWYGWTVTMSKDDWQGLHIHPSTNYSGVYYINVPDVPYPEGAIQFVNPHQISTAYGNGQPAGDFISPKSGDLIIFPSWLSHLVMPMRDTNERRYCLAFNIVTQKFWSEK